MTSPQPVSTVFEAIAPQRAFEEIAQQIRQQVAAGQLRPGDRLPAERDLSLQFNVSRNTLREALRALEHAGMIELRKGASGGAFILPGSSGVIINGMCDLFYLGAITPQHLTEARIWLADVVVRVACERATEEDFAALEANVEAASQAEKEGRFDDRQKLNRDFHIILARTTKNPIIEITIEGIARVMGFFIANIGPSENSFMQSSRHRFLKHLRNQDGEAAVKEMTSNLKRLEQNYLKRWKDKV